MCGLTVDIKVVSKEPALLYLCILTITNLSVAISSSSELDNRNRMCVKNIQRGRGIKLHFWHLSATATIPVPDQDLDLAQVTLIPGVNLEVGHLVQVANQKTATTRMVGSLKQRT